MRSRGQLVMSAKSNITRVAAVALLACTPLLGAACNGSCSTGDTCTCNSDSPCSISCSGGGCNFVCGNTNPMTVTGGECNFDCAGGGCEVLCEGDGPCDLSCPGGNCTLDCNMDGPCAITNCPTCTCNEHGGGTCKTS
jgi:hypothetical protein